MLQIGSLADRKSSLLQRGRRGCSIIIIIVMADQAVEDDIFVYTGGRAPQHVVNVIIDESVSEIAVMAFYDNRNLRCVNCHEGVKRIGREAFFRCPLLRQINLLGVKLIEAKAFYECRGLEDVEFGDVLETIGDGAFNQCIFSSCITFQSVRSIGNACFWGCTGITDVEFSENLERMEDMHLLDAQI